MALLKASFGGFKFWAITWSGPDGRRIVVHQGYGRRGGVTEDTGSDGRHERITALLTVAEYNQVRQIVHSAKVQLFTHPILGSWRARCNIGNRAPSDDVNKLSVELEFIEDTEQPPASPFDDETPESKKTQAKSLFEESEDIMSSTPGDSDTQALMDSYNDAWEEYSAQVNAYDFAIANWQDVEKAVDKLKSTGWAVIDNLQAFDTYQDGGREVCSAIARTLLLCHEHVELIKQGGLKWFNVLVTAQTDIWTLSEEVYGHYDLVDQVVAKNSILDPLYLKAGEMLEFPIEQ
jgi:prophage DNA circulation protein